MERLVELMGERQIAVRDGDRERSFAGFERTVLSLSGAGGNGSGRVRDGADIFGGGVGAGRAAWISAAGRGFVLCV
jgi:hypothetical protein